MNKEFRVLYVGHRFHTNQIPVMQGWNEYGVKPMFLAQYEGVGEVHDNVEFRLMKLSLLCRPMFYFLDKKYGPATAESKKINAFIPSLYDTIKQIKSYNPDLVIIRDYRKGNAVITLACKILRIKKVIMYVQDPLFGNYNKGSILRLLFRKILFPSIAFTPVLRKGEDRKTTLMSNAHDAPKYFVPFVYKAHQNTRDYYCKEGVIHILDIGKYREYKNHFFLVDAISSLNSFDKIRVTIIGQLSNKDERKYYSELKNYIDNKGMSRTFMLEGNIPYQNMPEVYSSNDILILASKDEPASMAVLEGMAHGLCVLASNNNGTSSYLDEFDGGIAFTTQKTTELEKRVNELLNEPKKIEAYGCKGLNTIKKYCSFENYLIKINEITEKEFDYKIPIVVEKS